MNRALILVASSLFLSACYHQARTYQLPSNSNQTQPKQESSENQSTTDAKDKMMGNTTVELTELNDSGLSGMATLEEVNGKVKVALELSGPKSSNPQPAHIHVGSCPEPGAVKYPLTSVVDGKSKTILDIKMSTIEETIKEEGSLAVNVHKSAQEAKTYVSCGNLK